MTDAHRPVHQQEKVGMQGTDVVQQIRHIQCQTQAHAGKIETPQHLQDSYSAVRVIAVVIAAAVRIKPQEIPKSRHPHICGNHHANGIV
eukprot:scaffold14782_cov174-Amphora_coffeaeformis.AAC.10